ncbi:MAG TPA: hypothetical protein VLB69_09945 [Rudaea sp.]|nr:hypothetical protein [Rudaea sp.]
MNYDQVFVASGSAATPYGYQITSGTPAGFGLGMNAATGELTGSPTQAGDFIITVTATDTDGCSGGRTYALAIATGDQTISFSSTAPAAAKVGGTAYDVAATATSGLAVTLTIDAAASSVCSISGSSVTFQSPGQCVIDANQAGDSNWNAAPQAQQSFTVGMGDQTITFTSSAPANATIGGATYDVTATATSGLTVTFTIDAVAAGVCSISGSTVSFIGSGSCVIDANQAGDANWNAAPQAQQSFAVGKIAQTISFTSTPPASAKNAGPTYDVSATATSSLAVTFTIDAAATSVCSIAGSTVSFIGAGTCVIDANQAGDGTYQPAPQVQQSFSVAPGDQTISFTSTLAAFVPTGGMYGATATATSGLAVTFTIDAASDANACSIAGASVTFGPNTGSCVIDANQSGDGNWNAAPQAQQSTTVLVAPAATDDSHAVTGNVAIAPAAANGVLGNDNGTSIAIKSYGATTGAEQTTLGVATATAQGGSITLNADGSYSYDPPANFTGTGGSGDSFKYVIDNSLAQPSTGTVTLDVSDRIMVVATSGVGAADCKPATACTLATADAASAVAAGKDLVFVQSGSYSGAACTLTSNQAIVGQQVALTTALADAGITLATDSVALPSFAAGTAPTLANAATVISLGGGNLVEYFTINPSGGSAIAGSSISNGANVHDITITGTSGANGVNLSSGTSGTYNFSNLVITTASGAAFTATGGGTVNVTTGTIPNTLTTSTGTAANVANTTIGASGVTFKSVTAGTAGSGPTNGIVLNNTGVTGAFTVAGGGTAASGGTIQSTAAEGIFITGPANASFSWMAIANPGTHGILSMGSGNSHSAGATTTNAGAKNLTIANTTITDSAGNTATDGGINAFNTTGTLSITGCTVSGAPHQGIFIDNNSNNLAALSMLGNTVSNSAGGDGVLMQMRGTSVLTSGTIGSAGNGNVFANNSSTGLQVVSGDSANIGSLGVASNTVTGNNAGMDLDVGPSAGSMTVVVQNNTITGSHSQALNLVASTSNTGGALTASLLNNTIGTAAVLDSGSAIGNGIRVANGGVIVSLTIDGNQIREVPNGRGIDIEPQAYVQNLALKAKIVNNTIVRPTGTNQSVCGAGVPCPEASIFVLSDNNALGGFDNACTVITGNTAYDPTSYALGSEAAYYLARRTTTSNTLTLEGNTGLTPSANILGNNTVTNATLASFIDEDAPARPTVVVAPGTCGTFP